MPFPGTAGSVWAPDTWAADTWTEDAWAGATVPPPPAPSTGSGGLGRVSKQDILAIERMLKQRGRVRAIQRTEARASGTVTNPAPRVPPKLKTLERGQVYDDESVEIAAVPVPEPAPPPEPISGTATAYATASCQAVGYVTMGDKDEMMGMMVGLNDEAFWRMIWEN